MTPSVFTCRQPVSTISERHSVEAVIPGRFHHSGIVPEESEHLVRTGVMGVHHVCKPGRRNGGLTDLFPESGFKAVTQFPVAGHRH